MISSCLSVSFRLGARQRPAPLVILARQMSQNAASQDSHGHGHGDVLFDKKEMTRTVTLHRPKALNSLNLHMVREMIPALDTWASSDLVDKVILKGSGPKAFCAGGDVRAIAEAGKKGGSLTKEFFNEEYQLNHLIGTYPKPIIAFIHGITMGGGVGLSVHAPIRIATENTLFAMPETAIGLFPDVGGSFFLPRLDGEIGMFLALTGHRIKGKDLVQAGIATHCISSSKLEYAESQLLNSNGLSSVQISEMLEDFSVDYDDEPFSLSRYRPIIDRCFSKGSVEEIIAALQEEKNPWADEVVKTMHKMSPTSLKITFRQIRQGKLLDFVECFKMEFRLTQRTMKGHDFYEGIRAVLIDKDQNPIWKPSSLSQVYDEEIQKFFEPLNPEVDGVKDFQPLKESTYHEYPHRRTALMSELSILKLALREPQVNVEQLVSRVRKDVGYQKKGIQEKIRDVVSRRCQISEGFVHPRL